MFVQLVEAAFDVLIVEPKASHPEPRVSFSAGRGHAEPLVKRVVGDVAKKVEIPSDGFNDLRNICQPNTAGEFRDVFRILDEFRFGESTFDEKHFAVALP